MASGFQGRDLSPAFGIGGGSVVRVPYQQRSDGGGGGGGGGGLLKRSLTELERQQQIQHALFLRSVKQRTHLASPISPPAPVDRSYSAAAVSAAEISAVGTPSSASTSSYSSGLDFVGRGQNLSPGDFSFSPPPPAKPDLERKSTMLNRLEELERQLLDDDEEDDEGSACGSGVTAAEWGETMVELLTPSQNPLSSPSPTTSSSSCSSSASCSPSSPTPSRQMLLDTATAISEGNLEAAATNLAVLKRAANPRGDPDQRLTEMMVAALLSRINAPPPGSHPIAELCSGEHQAATQRLYDISPCFKLGLLTANLAILEATKDSHKVHILDFDVGQGGQYAALIHALAERHRRSSIRPPAVKITAVCDPTSPFNCFGGANSRDANLRMVGDWIAKLAERVGVGLRFSIVSRRAAELDQESLGCEPGEALAVNFAFLLSRVADESVSPANPRDELLRRVRALGPRVVALVEQEVNGNTAPFAARFAEACGHYGALLESLDATAGRESVERARVEGCLARKAANTVAREGAERVERCEVFGKWRARMGMAGFQPFQLGPAVSEPVKARLASYLGNPGFTLKEEAGGLCFGWMGRVLTVSSSWR